LYTGDLLLLGTDLEQSVPRLIDAYDDPVGVTAAFNLNLLARINRELHADFDVRRFEHIARFNRETSSIEMHLRSKQKQEVTIPDACISVTFQAGETIWTENSHKYSLDELAGMAKTAGFHIDAQWTDREWPFAETLLAA
jgi:uncharacterized SAM-dependent methyltransferase